ncbi:MAG: EFR1 family ferrodoxin [Clostridiales Family XIII bacterium]|nr:EFR1 family ferrodoxin [Clostridiales Family XIII bacterium]
MKESNKINRLTRIFKFINSNFIAKVSDTDKNFTVAGNCTGWGICEEVCPVNNIETADNKPQYRQHCEQCIACIQYCPGRAINYKNATRNRRSYTNPEIDYKELSKKNTKKRACRRCCDVRQTHNRSRSAILREPKERQIPDICVQSMGILKVTPSFSSSSTSVNMIFRPTESMGTS